MVAPLLVLFISLTLCSSQQATSHAECAAYLDNPVSLPSLLTFPDAANAPYISARYTNEQCLCTV